MFPMLKTKRFKLFLETATEKPAFQYPKLAALEELVPLAPVSPSEFYFEENLVGEMIYDMLMFRMEVLLCMCWYKNTGGARVA